MQEYEKYGNICMQISTVLSTRTAAQIKKHAECFFKQNVKANSAAVKQYRESLSPDEKARVLVINSAAHQKQRRLRHQAGRHHRAPAAATSAKVRQPPRYHCLQNKLQRNNIN
jgi:hypothetical protein